MQSAEIVEKLKGFDWIPCRICMKMETSGGHISSTTASWGLPSMFLGSPGFPLQKRVLGHFWPRGPLGGQNWAPGTPPDPQNLKNREKSRFSRSKSRSRSRKSREKIAKIFAKAVGGGWNRLGGSIPYQPPPRLA